MEAARIAALRGHKVTLVEKDATLGGAVAALALDPVMAEFGNIVEYLSVQMTKLGIEVHVCKEANDELIKIQKPDVVILAAGSSAQVPDVVKGKPGVLTHDEALRQKAAIGQRVVVWGFFGAEMAIGLARQGRDVVLLGKSGEASLASDLPRSRKWWVLRQLTDLNFVREAPEAQKLPNVQVFYNAEVEKIDAAGIHVKLSDNTSRQPIIPYDTLIISQRFGERQPNDALFRALQGKVEVHKIGDCLQVRGIKEAIWTANEVARKI
jgi:heterodisulfide reductase subunit A-like polyferredoxin